MKAIFCGDFDLSYSAKLCDDLGQTEIAGKRCEIENFTIDEITAANLNEYYAVFLAVTDVTKFFNSEKKINAFCERLLDYVHKGGRLISMHDVLYRRCRNIKLQEKYTYRIEKFQQQKKVVYRKTKRARLMPAFKDLPDSFSLGDNEVCWGSLDRLTAHVYFETDISVTEYSEEKNKTETREITIPLVMGKEYGKGMLFWLNSGDMDFSDEPPESITKADVNLVKLLKTVLVLNENKEESLRERFIARLLTGLKPCDAGKPYVVAAYSSDNEIRVFSNVFLLQEAGVNVWIDKLNNKDDGLPRTNGWKTGFVEAVQNRNCRGVLFFMDETYLDKKVSEEEIEIVLQNEKRFSLILSGLDSKQLIKQIQKLPSLDAEKKRNLLVDFLQIETGSNDIRRIYFIEQIKMNHWSGNESKNLQLLNMLIDWDLLAQSADTRKLGLNRFSQSCEKLKKRLLDVSEG